MLADESLALLFVGLLSVGHECGGGDSDYGKDDARSCCPDLHATPEADAEYADHSTSGRTEDDENRTDDKNVSGEDAAHEALHT